VKGSAAEESESRLGEEEQNRCENERNGEES